jgi:RHS repeat-associated protein
LVPNNAYLIRLRANDSIGEVSKTIEVSVNSGALKLGPFSLEYQDLHVPAIGLPIVIRRFYDSSNPQTTDFGPGWTLGFSKMDLRIDSAGNVYVTLPNGRRTAFAFTPQRLSAFFPVYSNHYTAPAGVTDTLENLDCPSLIGFPGGFLCGFDPFHEDLFRLTTKEGFVYQVAAGGSISQISDRQGNSIQITAAGVTSSSGRNASFARDPAGRITSITDPGGRKLLYGYDSLGRLNQFTDRNGNVTTYQYAGNSSQMTAIQAAGGCSPLKTEYGPDGRVSAKVDNQGNRSTYAYDITGRVERITNARGNTTTYTYDAGGNLIRLADALGGVTSFTYDSNNYNTSITLPSGRKIQRVVDARGNMLSETDLAPGGTLSLTTVYTYTPLDLISTVTKPAGDKTVFSYDDSNSKVVQRSFLDPAGNVLRSEEYTYDTSGNTLSTTRGSETIRFTYNAFGDVTGTRDGAGAGSSFEYDANGNTIARTDGAGNRTTMTYDGFNNLSSIAQGSATLSSVVFNNLNMPAELTDGLGHKMTYAYDCAAKLTQVTDAAGRNTAYGLDSVSNVIGTTDALGRKTNYAYDANNRQTSRTDPTGVIWGFSYTPDGYLASQTMPAGAAIQGSYDGLDRLVRETYPEGQISYSFDDIGRVTTVTDARGGASKLTSFGYDGLGRVTAVTDPNSRTITYAYGSNGRRRSMMTPDGQTTVYSYDGGGRLATVQTGTAAATITYDTVGRRVRKSFSNGASDNYSYDSLSRLSAVTVRDSTGAVAATYTYTRDNFGNRTRLSLSDGAVTYGFDSLNRLISEQSSSASLGVYQRTWSYDAVGNRQDPGSSFGADNRLLQWTHDANGNVLTANGATFNYDSLNRLVSYQKASATATYSYDYRGRRVSKTVGGTTRQYLYDGEDIAVVYLGGVQTARYTFGGRSDEPLMVSTGGSTYFFHTDDLGSVVAISDASGKIVQRYGYDAWGNLQQSSGSFAASGTGLVNTFTFTGREYDDESSLYYYRARTYNPAAGRFLQKDALQGRSTDPATQNLYTYVLNNPTRYTDPSGRQEILEYSYMISGPSVQAQAAGLIGFVQGFAIPNLIFLGQYLSFANNETSPEDVWASALTATEDAVKDIEDRLSCPVRGEDGKCYTPTEKLKVAGNEIGGIVGAYLDGTTYQSTGTLNGAIKSILGECEVESEFETPGFRSGAELALFRLGGGAPKNESDKFSLKCTFKHK